MPTAIYKQFLAYLCVLCAVPAIAQTDDEQVLIFRKSGEVNLLYSSEVDSIVATKTDVNGVEHEQCVRQLFYTNDTVLAVPVEEIDSICFGSRNVVEYKNDLLLIDASNRQWIVGYDGTHIFFDTNTPAYMLPMVGRTVFYGDVDDIFPAGLVVRITAVSTKPEYIEATIEKAELEDVFSRFFFAGNATPAEQRKMRRAHALLPLSAATQLEVDKVGSIGISADGNLEATFVANPLKHYYHADIRLDGQVALDIAAKAQLLDYKYVSPAICKLNFPGVPLILIPSLRFSAFLDLKGELQLKAALSQDFTTHFEWERHNNQNTIKTKGQPLVKPGSRELKGSLTCNGEVFFGARFLVDINLIGQYGVDTYLKVGPSLQGELGVEIMQQLNQGYNSELYAKGTISACTKMALEGETYNPEHIIFGKRDEHTIFTNSWELSKSEIELFPHFMLAKATAPLNRQEVSVAVKVPEPETTEQEAPIVMPEPEIGFQLLDSQDEVIDSAFVQPQPAIDDTPLKGYTTTFKEQQSEPMQMRPVFHYAGYTLPYKNVDVQAEGLVMPFITYSTTGPISVIAGATQVGSTVIDSTQYIIGNYLAVPVADPVFSSNPSGYFCSWPNNDRTVLDNTILGTWTGEDITLTLNADKTCTLQHNGQAIASGCSYELNTPMIGDVSIFTPTVPIIFRVVSQDSQTLTLRFQHESTIISLRR